MIGRYQTEAMAQLFGDAARFARWTEIELAACDAWAARGEIPARDMAELRGDTAPATPAPEPAKTTFDPTAIVKQAYLRTLSRYPSDQELARCRQSIEQASDTTTGVRDVLWALLNTKEFIVNH